MKIVIQERGSKFYYDEFLYIASYYKKIRKHPNKRVYPLTKYLIVYEIILILSMSLMGFFYWKIPNLFYIFLLGILFFLFLFVLFYFVLIKRKIQMFMNVTGDKIIEIDEEGIKYSDFEKVYRMKWEDVSSIIFNRYSICFLPNENSRVLISVFIDYEDKVLKGIKKYQKESLIVYNKKEGGL